MSELNVYHHELRPDEYDEFYLKSEADKVIAELKEENEKLKATPEQIMKEVFDKCLIYPKEMVRLDDAYKLAVSLRNQKYKRCLDNAWGCQQRMEFFHELVLEEARTIALPNEVALKEYRRKRERAAKWNKRWLKIAEKFKDKEAK